MTKSKVNPLGKLSFTSRGFELIEFVDKDGYAASIQQSSAFDDDHSDKPGQSYVWIGLDKTPIGSTGDAMSLRMCISRDQAESLIAHLGKWLKKGTFKI